MKRSFGRYGLRVYTVLSVLLTFILIFTLLPQQAFAEQIRNSNYESRNNVEITENPVIIITTGAATEITADSAMLNGTISGLGTDEKATVYFEYGNDTGYGNTTDKLDITTNGEFFIRLINLTPDTIYHYRAGAALNSESTIFGEDLVFTTSTKETTITEPPSPEITTTESTPPSEITTTEPAPLETTTTDEVSPETTPTTTETQEQPPVLENTVYTSDITATSVVLNGILAEIGSAAEVEISFEYGEDVTYGYTTEITKLAASGAFSSSITGLKPDTTYHFRAKAASSNGTTSSEDASFTTPAEKHTPKLDAVGVTNVTGTSATLTGILADTGSTGDVDVCFEYGLDTSYGNLTEIQKMTAAGNFTANIVDLKPATVYHFRAKAMNAAGETYSDDIIFSTPSPCPLELKSNKTKAHVDPDKETKFNSTSGKITVKFPKNAIDNPIRR